MCNQDPKITGQAFFLRKREFLSFGGKRRVRLGLNEVLSLGEGLPWVGGFFSLQEGARTEATGAAVGMLGGCQSSLS